VSTRRRMLACLAAVAVSIPAGLVLAPAAPAGAVPATIPLLIKNNSGRSGPVYLYVLGESLTTKRLGYADANGTFREWPGAGVPPVDAPDVSIPGPSNGQEKIIRIPKLSGRIYFSIGAKIPFKIVSTPIGTGLVQPAPWAPNDPSRDILFDWSEYTLNDSGLWLNSSRTPSASRMPTATSGAPAT
jgi:hypothetical protein